MVLICSTVPTICSGGNDSSLHAFRLGQPENDNKHHEGVFRIFSRHRQEIVKMIDYNGRHSLVTAGWHFCCWFCGRGFGMGEVGRALSRLTGRHNDTGRQV